MKKIFLPSFVSLILMPFIGACGSSSLSELTTTQQLLKLVMYGEYVEPSGATGNEDPRFMNFTFTGLSLALADGSGNVIETANPVLSATIVDRPQILFSTNFKAYQNTSFSKATITFDSSVTAAGDYSDSNELTLTSPTLTYDQPFAESTGQGLTITVKIKWENIITKNTDAKTEEVSQPDFDVEITN